jgi:hypothetical protein
MHEDFLVSDAAATCEMLERWRAPRPRAIVIVMRKIAAQRPLIAGVLALLSSCASVEFKRDSQTSGTFVSTGWSFTILSYDLPKGALKIARENASDARQPNMVVTDATVVPYLGPFDVLLDIISIRYARVIGTWGFPPTE